MRRFLNNNTFYKPNVEKHSAWGLLMLTDRNNQVSSLKFEMIEGSDKLANRFQLWRLSCGKQEKYFALAYFPFAGDECITEVNALSDSANSYRKSINDLLDQYTNENLVFCADFNFNPYLIKHWKDRELDQITHNNSILITAEETGTKSVSVDGVLLSVKEKQKLHTSLQPSSQLFENLKKEYRFFKFWDSLQKVNSTQKQLDKQQSLVLKYYQSE